jgi:hypothetical protein
MDFAKLLEPYRTGEHGKDVTPESQVKWLRRLGFPNDVIDRVMIAVYTEVEQGTRKFNGWEDFNICLKETAKVAQTKDLEAYIKRLEEFEANLRSRWESKLPWWKRFLGIKR